MCNKVDLFNLVGYDWRSAIISLIMSNPALRLEFPAFRNLFYEGRDDNRLREFNNKSESRIRSISRSIG